jgi:hypothetical protein
MRTTAVPASVGKRSRSGVDHRRASPPTGHWLVEQIRLAFCRWLVPNELRQRNHGAFRNRACPRRGRHTGGLWIDAELCWRSPENVPLDISPRAGTCRRSDSTRNRWKGIEPIIGPTTPASSATCCAPIGISFESRRAHPASPQCSVQSGPRSLSVTQRLPVPISPFSTNTMTN